MKFSSLLFAALSSLSSLAQANSLESSVQALSRCDASFFKLLSESKPVFAKLTPLDTTGSMPTLAVPNRKHPTRSRVMFKSPVKVAGVQVLGYFDEIVDLPENMSGYSWGYLVGASVEATAQAFKPLVWEPERLRKEDPVYVRSEVWSHAEPSLGWARVVTESGLPKPRTVERVLLIEPYDGETAFVRFGCSIQGKVIDPIIRELRPDLR